MTSKLVSLVRSVPPGRAAFVAALAALGLWAYWPTLGAMSHKWIHDPQYSHGYLVPAFAGVLLWLRRYQMPAAAARPCGWGLALMLAGVLLRLAGAYAYFDWLDAASLLPCLARRSSCSWGGGEPLRWSWPAIAFLLFMIPLPFRLETALSHPLQRIATQGSTYVMQTLGLAALAEGNTIRLDHGTIGVVEACNGLSMMLIFFALATATAIVIKRPLLDKAVILLSAAPIAVIANVLRITATGAAQELVSPEAAHAIFHDWAGWLMMPLALGLLWGELWLLSQILKERSVAGPVAAGLPRGVGVPAPSTANGKRHKQKRRSIPLPPPVRPV